MFCPKCGIGIKDGDKFCPNCGAEQSKPSATHEKTRPVNPNVIIIPLGIIIVVAGLYIGLEKRQYAKAETAKIQAETAKIQASNQKLSAELNGVSDDTPDIIVAEMCHERLHKLAKYQADITSTDIDRTRGKGITLVTGIAKFQNGFGAWDSKSYKCHMAAPRSIYIHLDGELVATFNTLID
ncbi:zinc ribbon domain-containing protein [Marinobacterium sediminicola]|uniref:Zinc-ribbon domain-containing protein n=1 Tax=Marinobacterium sediminicola TaxID=518898 RepID=A0ABY1S2Y5_9GAMM|nr:zinc ribbon domain-containing protein [Marinobacterium sediminicola]ULG69292.1 zinc ribbon domain-containing protein [Marinobacterium sediminicola]SMR77642.1 zinc-ribbon domain-containing protein [Marinobacterium sediminicola]